MKGVDGMYPATPPRIAVINGNDDILEIITAALTDEGYIAIPAHVRALRLGLESLNQFIAEHAPQVILWDIAPPLEINWQFFQKVKHLPIMQGCRFILTTTNVRRLREIAGEKADGAIEIIGKPYELGEIFSAIQKALAVC
jgi:CheY-like chemotaxis protein